MQEEISLSHSIPSTSGCDCHLHLLVPGERGPADIASAVEGLRHKLQSMSLTRCVLVQPTGYGTDPFVIVEACRLLGDKARAVGAKTTDVSEDDLDSMHAAGVRGLRFTEIRDPITSAVYPGGIGIEHFKDLAPRLKRRGWHAELWAPSAFIASEGRALLTHDVPLVIGHIGLIKSADDPAIPVLCDFLASGQVWTKLSLCRIVGDDAQTLAVRKLHDRLVSNWPRQLLWGSDWPYLGMQVPEDKPNRMLETFKDWVADPDLIDTILIDNPSDVYGFEPRALNSTR